jgi:hypothetical protein
MECGRTGLALAYHIDADAMLAGPMGSHAIYARSGTDERKGRVAIDPDPKRDGPCSDNEVYGRTAKSGFPIGTGPLPDIALHIDHASADVER